MEGSDTRERRSVVQQFTKNHPPRNEPEVEEANELYQQARARSRDVLMLDVMFLDGTVESFDYASLRRVRYRPDGTMILLFGRTEVTAHGKNLMRWREQITEHRLRFIQEETVTERMLKPEDAAHIEKIVITEGDDTL